MQEVREPEGFFMSCCRGFLSAAPAGDGETVVELYRRLYGAEQGAKVIYVGTEDDPALADFCPPEHLVSLLCRPDAQGQGRVYTFWQRGTMRPGWRSWNCTERKTMTAKAAAGFTLRTHKGIERGGGLLPALGAALLLAGIAGQVCSAMGMPVDGLLLLAGMAAVVCAAALTGRRDRLALLPLGVLLAAAVFCAVFHTAVGDSLLGLVNRYLAQRQSREAVVCALRLQ